MIKTQEQWLESECPKCFGCNQRIAQGQLVGLRVYCAPCFDSLMREADAVYNALPRNEQGKVIARKPRE